MKKIFLVISFLIIMLTLSACYKGSNKINYTAITTPTQIPIQIPTQIPIPSPSNAPKSHDIITTTPVPDDVSITEIPNDGLGSQIKDNPEENDNNENSEDASQVVNNKTHLEFYDEFDEYNSSQENSKDFILSEVWIDGDAYYQFLNEAKAIKIIVDQTQENAIIYHDEKSMDYDIGYLFDRAHVNTEIELCDVTGDEEEELIIIHSYVGFGEYETYCDVINLSTMTHYDIEQYFEALCSKISVEPIKITEDNSMVFRITDINGNVSYGTATIENGSSDLNDYQPFVVSKYASIHEHANHEKKCLSVSIDVILDDCFTYLCDISSDLILNTNTNCFELSDSFEVSIDNIY